MKMLFFIYSFYFFHSVAVAQPFKKLQEKVKLLYENMTFSGVDLTVTGIPLVNTPSNIAFAQFDPKRNKRYILINYKFFSVNYWDNKKDNLTENGQDILRGVIAHEWAHHYMGHTFERSTIIKERNADIIAGRILYECLTENRGSVDTLTEKQLGRALRVDTLFKQRGTFHLDKNFRRVMMKKGFILGLIIDYRRNSKHKQTLTGSLTTVIMQDVHHRDDSLQQVYVRMAKIQLDSLIRVRLPKDTIVIKNLSKYMQRDYKFPTDIDKAKWKNTLEIPKIIKITADSLLSRVIETYKKKREFLSVYTIKNLPINKRMKIDPIYVKASLENPKKTDPITMETEALYNLAYLDTPGGGWAKRYNNVIKKLQEHNNIIDTISDLTYELQGGIKFTLHHKNNPVTMEYKSQKSIYDSKKMQSDTTKFRYEFFFPLDKARYFVDKNYHLWTETIGAKAIDNKLFLQPNNLY